MRLTPVAYIYNNFTSKFGIPRQSGLTGVLSTIAFTGEFRNPNYVKGIEEFSHLWLVWGFSQSEPSASATVRPPRLGGNKTMGVFATRSPYRPNPLGLTLVKLEQVQKKENETLLLVSGADLMNGTPIYDIKPYLPYADVAQDAKAGYATNAPERKLSVLFQTDIPKDLSPAYLEELKSVLSYDPRPAYHTDETRTYGLTFGAYDVKFTVQNETAVVLAFLPTQNSN